MVSIAPLRWAPGRLCWVYSPGCCTDAGRFQSHRCDGLPGAGGRRGDGHPEQNRRGCFNRTVAMGSREPLGITVDDCIAIEDVSIAPLRWAPGSPACLTRPPRNGCISFNRTVAMGSREPVKDVGEFEVFRYEVSIAPLRWAPGSPTSYSTFVVPTFNNVSIAPLRWAPGSRVVWQYRIVHLLFDRFNRTVAMGSREPA